MYSYIEVAEAENTVSVGGGGGGGGGVGGDDKTGGKNPRHWQRNWAVSGVLNMRDLRVESWVASKQTNIKHFFFHQSL